jgi:hypothetical protein
MEINEKIIDVSSADRNKNKNPLSGLTVTGLTRVYYSTGGGCDSSSV